MRSPIITDAPTSPPEAAAAEPAPADATAAASVPHTIIIEPPRGWQGIDMAELWRYRELLFFLTWRDVKVRYKQTVLGAAWAVLQPAMMMVVFTIFFGRLANVSSGDVWYPLFALCGLLPWFFFSTALTNAANSVVGSERLITKIYFPRLAVPVAAVAAAAVDFVVACSLLAVLVAFQGVWPGWQILLAPVVFVIVALFAAGLGALLAALNVAYRDFRYVVPFLIQVGMFATPTIYLQPSGNEGTMVKLLLALNPLTSLVSAFRASVLGGPIHWSGLGVALLASLALLVMGSLYFRRIEDRFADII